MRKAIGLANVGDNVQNRNFDALEKAANDLARRPFANAIEAQDFSLVSGANTVDHGLGRKPQGMLVVSQTAGETIYFDRNATTTNARQAVLQSTGTVVATVVWF